MVEAYILPIYLNNKPCALIQTKMAQLCHCSFIHCIQDFEL